MKIASYVFLGLLSCVEVLARKTAFDKAVEAYRTYQKAQYAYFEAIDAHEETRLAWDAYRAVDRAEEVKGAYAIYQITAYGYDKALHTIEEVQLAFAAWKEAKSAIDEANSVIEEAIRTGRPAGTKADRVVDEALDAFEEADDTYFTVLEVFEEAIKKAYERGEKNH